MPVTTEIVKITPRKAEEWLGSNSHNRSIRNRRVEELRAAIERGEWKLNGDAIRFDVNGTLLDGQHRLWAIALGEITVPCLVVRGLEPESQSTIDLGARRNLADTLRLQGEGNASRLAALLVAKWRLDNGFIQSTTNPSIAQAIAVLDANASIRDSLRIYLRATNSAMHVNSALPLLHYEFSSIDADAADFFFERLIDGVNLDAKSPILLLRERLIATRTSLPMMAALTIKAWNAYMGGVKLGNLMWRPVGVNAEVFPAIEGKKARA